MNRKRLKREHRTLSNGQILSLQSGIDCCYDYLNKTRKVYYISAIIGKSIKENNKWFNKHRGRCANIRETGRCGLEGLREASKYIQELMSNIRENDLIVIHALDKRRKSAYRYLERYGFQLDEEELIYMFVK